MGKTRKLETMVAQGSQVVDAYKNTESIQIYPSGSNVTGNMTSVDIVKRTGVAHSLTHSLTDFLSIYLASQNISFLYDCQILPTTHLQPTMIVPTSSKDFFDLANLHPQSSRQEPLLQTRSARYSKPFTREAKTGGGPQHLQKESEDTSYP